MIKRPFDIKCRPQIESGEYKVETRGGKPVKLLSINSYNTRPIIGEVELDGKTVYISTDENGSWTEGNGENQFDLFIVTPEEELSEFENAMLKYIQDGLSAKDEEDVIKITKEHAAELLALAIDARADELSEGLKQSKIDEDSIPYHLIEFMCNLYDCQNWEEIEEIAELYVTRIKAAALKDLPRWKKAYKACYIGDSIIVDEYGYYRSDTVKPGCHYILISDIEKLPGFKED